MSRVEAYQTRSSSLDLGKLLVWIAVVVGPWAVILGLGTHFVRVLH